MNEIEFREKAKVIISGIPITQQALAFLLGTSQPALNKYINTDYEPKIETLVYWLDRIGYYTNFNIKRKL